MKSTRRLRSERGVSLIHVAIAIFVLMGFSAFVLDHGVLMLARGQAQNVADMAAIAGATSRAMDEPGANNPPANGITENVIKSAVDSHKIFAGTPANIGRTWGWACPPGVSGWCVQVDVFRDGSNGSTTLPVYFANLFDTNDQKMKATATAVAKYGNGTRCLKPWLIPDKWEENSVPPDDEFNPPLDVYTPYNYQTNTPGTGYTLNDILTLVLVKPGNPHKAISASDFYRIGDANIYKESIIGCLITAKIDDVVSARPGNGEGPTVSGVETLIANGPVDVVVGMFSPTEFMALDRQHGNFDLHIVNMMSVHITGVGEGGTITGTITGGVGDDLGGGPVPTGNGSLIKVIQLVR